MKIQTKKTLYSLCTLVAVGAILAVLVHFVYLAHPTAPAAVPSAPNTSVSSAIAGASLSLISPSGATVPSAAVDVGDREHVTWTSNDYFAPTVSVNIIREVSDNPARYELVRTVASAMPNDGDALWVPNSLDAGDNTFVQVGCTLSAQACTASSVTDAAPLAVLDTGLYNNTASVYDASFEAIEALYNK